MMLRDKKIKVIIDTNLWISFLISREYEKLDFLFSSKRVCLLFSQRLFAEFIGVASREKFRKWFSETDLSELSARMKKIAKIVKTKTVVAQCRDPKDNFLLELAVDGKADYLVTGDIDLLTLKRAGNTEIITMRDFLNLYRT
ncbi:MAG: putative toxin-antitoxin system toxin component, PIN family [Candidatus Symbiothrix sp.]|jgi:putative PIN family toxin of toxin-antitoxin system|nr:putative toxin-antitoxin system toxin component, PIN family [Candidatus Symbiothrix sp.]